MTIEVVDFPIQNGGSFHSYVSLPEGNLKHGARVDPPPVYTSQDRQSATTWPPRVKGDSGIGQQNSPESVVWATDSLGISGNQNSQIPEAGWWWLEHWFSMG